MKPFDEEAGGENPDDEEVKSELAEEDQQKEVQFAPELAEIPEKVEYVGNNITKTNACNTPLLYNL